MSAAFIAGDWGTSRLRLFLCDAMGDVLDSKSGPGIAEARGNAADIFLSLSQPWGALPAILCGMVGSSLGWREVAYLSCPTPAWHLARGTTRFAVGSRQIVLVPGLFCRNPLGAPDTMRGEETQILGALHRHADLARGRHLLCLPGTHSKWALLQDGIVERFLTAVSGELFDILLRHSILIKAGGIDLPTIGHIDADPSDESFLHRLFAARSRQLSGEFGPAEAAAYLSGLIVAQDVAGALRLFGREADSVTVIGAPDLGERYLRALEKQEIAASVIDGDDASLAGLCALHQELFA